MIKAIKYFHHKTFGYITFVRNLEIFFYLNTYVYVNLIAGRIFFERCAFGLKLPARVVIKVNESV